VDIPLKPNGFSLDSCATFPANFMKNDWVVFVNPANKQTNATENITFLAKLINETFQKQQGTLWELNEMQSAHNSGINLLGH